MNRRMQAKTLLRWLAGRSVTLVLFVLAVWGAYTLGKHGADVPREEALVTPTAAQEEVWTCPMHPQIRMPEPDDCPICGMELVREEAEEAAPRMQDVAKEPEPAGYACAMFCVPPLPNPGKCPVCGMDMVAVYDEPATEGDTERRMTMSEEARALADIQTAPVVRRHAHRELSMVGVIEADETRLARVTAYVGGRLDRLHIRYTGAQVERGAPLAGLYSPELLTARAELLQAKQSAARLADSTLASVRDGAESTVRAARERLRLWGLSEAQVRALESGDGADAIISISAPISGVVIERHVQQGDYVDIGDLIFTVADLSVMWLQLKAYERDLMWMAVGQPVRFTVDAYPGEQFEGQIAFIEPVLAGAARTINARVEIDNEDGRLKPGMFARAVVETPVAGADETAPLLIPDTAPLITGARAVVYVAVPDQERPTFEGRDVALGPRVDGHYVVKTGLHEGERVVVKGAFRIDSALQIRTRPSMMQSQVYDDAVGLPIVHEHDSEDPACCPLVDTPPLDAANREQLQAVLADYISTQQALAADDLNTAREGYKALATTTAAALESVSDDTPSLWARVMRTAQENTRKVSDTTDIEAARKHFQPVSNALIELLEAYSDAPDTSVIRAYCPMAFDDAGAAWLQKGKEIRNPYFGAAMLQCGIIQETYGKAEALPAP